MQSIENQNWSVQLCKWYQHVYNKFIEEICKTLSKAHDVCAKWACTHDATFTSKKYELVWLLEEELSHG